MPRNVKRFAWLWVISFLFQIPGIFLLPPDAAATRLGISHAAEQKLSAAIGILFFAVLLPFLQLAVWKRKNWARWLLFVAYIIFLPILFMNHAFRPDHLPMTTIGFASQLIEAAAFYFAFTGDARPWFRPQNSK
jgi:hypothetical protein